MPDWPVAPGDWEIGNPRSPIAIAFFGSKNISMPKKFYAIKGTCETENIGIEKIIVNTISNPHIRYLLLCGGEIFGHFPKNSLKALHENGVNEKGKIIEAKGKIPYIVNIPRDAIERFRDQVELIDLTGDRGPEEDVKSTGKVDTIPVDLDKIVETVEICMRKKPEKYGKDPVIIKIGTLQADEDTLGPEIIGFTDKYFAMRLAPRRERLITKLDFIVVSPEFNTILNPVLGEISMMACSMNFMRRVVKYLRREE